ncbi:hypothetical protein CEN50_04730 [Fischerella thermalis CCMEE 5268]|uniref:Uncharacterized protein n=1 Tax=Fischerella thermalis CCMEE 5268 TaxID=2019662 RepID=A0A2N6KK34_9CYAN|nr:hypothetical protein CEN50_04730 [Fischerella thermalis CCMEE 5268]
MIGVNDQISRSRVNAELKFSISIVEQIAIGGLITVVLIVTYAGFAWKFWSGYGNTNFTRSTTNRLIFSLLWPVLLITNKSYRQNFRKALKGR